LPNGYGLFDMAGNVWEWVLDDFDHQHLAWKSTSCPRDPVAQREGAEKVMRGGSFMCHKSYCWRSAARALAIPAVAAQTPPRSPFFTVPPDATTRHPACIRRNVRLVPNERREIAIESRSAAGDATVATR
jgi:hypothetical protein